MEQISSSLNALIMRRAHYPGKSGNWESYNEEFQKDGTLSAWASFKVKECYEKVESEEKGRLSIAQDILRNSMDFLMRIIVPNDGVGGVTLSYVWTHCHCFSLEDYIWWVSSRRGKEAV